MLLVMLMLRRVKQGYRVRSRLLTLLLRLFRCENRCTGGFIPRNAFLQTNFHILKTLLQVGDLLHFGMHRMTLMTKTRNQEPFTSSNQWLIISLISFFKSTFNLGIRLQLQTLTNLRLLLRLTRFTLLRHTNL